MTLPVQVDGKEVNLKIVNNKYYFLYLYLFFISSFMKRFIKYDIKKSFSNQPLKIYFYYF